jgi:hypothetical protein
VVRSRASERADGMGGRMEGEKVGTDGVRSEARDLGFEWSG